MPKKRERRYDEHGQLIKMAEADGWVMVRRPYAIPGTMTTKEWNALATEPIITQTDEAPAAEDLGQIYFIDGGEHIKIGYSRSLDHRMRKMGTDLPGGAKVLLVQPGTYRIEKVMHRHFAALHYRGEWFHKGPELLAYIEEQRNRRQAP